MNSTIYRILSTSFIFFFGVYNSYASAETSMVRNAVCKHENKVYSLLSERNVGLKANNTYTVVEKTPNAPLADLPRMTIGHLKQDIQLPKHWRPTTIPLTACEETKEPARSPVIKINFGGSMIREFYAKVYFLTANFENSPIDIEELVKSGDAIPLKVRLLCTSSEIAEDITMCESVKLMDEVIPINP